MNPRSTAWTKAGSYAQLYFGKSCRRSKGTTASAAIQGPRVSTPENERPDLTSHYVSISQNENQKRSQTRDFLISTLESAPTRRDAKQYLQTFGAKVARSKARGSDKPKVSDPTGAHPSPSGVEAGVLGDGIRAVYDSPKFVQPGKRVKETTRDVDEVPHVAIVKFKDPHLLEDAALEGVAKTFAQLRTLGMPSIVVVDCDLRSMDGVDWMSKFSHQLIRIAEAVDAYGEPWVRIVDSAISVNPGLDSKDSPFTAGTISIDLEEALSAPLEEGTVILVPSYAVSTDRHQAKLVDSNEVILALTRHLSGLQLPAPSHKQGLGIDGRAQHSKKALVDRIIMLDKLGGIPAKHRRNAAHMFLNMEDELETAKDDLDSIFADETSTSGDRNPGEESSASIKQRHMDNLDLAMKTLAILPPTSSALITTPQEAANLMHSRDNGVQGPDADLVGFVGTVGTRKRLNPLIHNLLTDRPVYSSSLPLGRIKPIARGADSSTPGMSATTLAKRGMPVTIFPDPRTTPWAAPQPGAPRLRLTDTCIDLPRLVHLIDDSFNRKLDVQHYLERVSDNLAGVIIAGEYEGGAILTWERPSGMDMETAYRSGRLVPYLDKFAVLKKSQGAGGVADIVFNAMVWDCFPEGVCWRSRRNNPVNKWYFERSKGTWKLDESSWAMFWTTPYVGLGDAKFRDYEDVCRNVVPSWADNKHIVD